ncbi:MAG: CusA/CzcA family heavy metal efflux RND transporter [Bacteroidetes bacterium]|nr:CusA/CzcA family heavy metal efflux RND transporter [Bacteroidota bacterium]
MIHRIIVWSAANSTLVLLATLLVASLGIWAMMQTPVDAIPDLSDVQVIIKTDYHDQGPRIVEEQVTYPLATAMLAVPQAKTVRGFSLFGVSFVYVLFEDQTDQYWARSRVLEVLSYVGEDLPEGVRPTLGPDATGLGWVYAYSVIDRSGARDLAQLRSIQDFFLKYELQAVKGVAEIATIGGFQKQYQVVVDPQKLAAYGIAPNEVGEALRRSNRDVGARLLELGEREYIVRGLGYLQGQGDIRAVPLRTAQGTPVTIGDIATVRIGPEIRRGLAEKDGEGEVVGGIVVMRHGENAQEVIRHVKQRLAAIQHSLPEGVEIITEYDRSNLIARAVGTLKTKLWQELAIVALIVLLFLVHVRSALVALITIPVGILIALLVMYLLGINANIMSLGGIAISIGVMADASLVMVENAHKHVGRLRSVSGMETQGAGSPVLSPTQRLEAISAAAKELGPSLFFSLLIVTVSFLPVFTLGEIEGRLFRPLAFTKTFAMAASALLAVTLVPALMVVLIRGRIRNEEDSLLNRYIMGVYRFLLRATLRHPVTTLVGGALLLVLSLLPLQRLLFRDVVVPFVQIGSEFMPPLDEGDLLYMPTTLPGISLQKAKELLQQTNRIIASFPEVEGVFGKVGRAETATDPAPPSMIETIIRLKPTSDWRNGLTRDGLIRELDRAIQIPGLTNAWTMPIQARLDMLTTGIRTPVGIKITGPDLQALESIGEQVEDALRPVSGTLSVYSERVMGGSFLNIDIDRVEAGRYGLTTGDVQDIIATAIGGMNVTTTVEGLERYPVNVRYPRALRDNLPALLNVLVPTKSGGQIPLGQIATLSLVSGPAMIKSEDARPAAWVFVDLQRGTDLGSYVRQAQRVVEDQVALPAGYVLSWGGRFTYMQRANSRLLLLVPVTILLVFLLLFIHFKSAMESLLLLIPLPFAASGAIWLLSILNYRLSVAVGVGIIAVVGLAAETGVVMFVYLRQAIDRYQRKGLLSSQQNLLQALEQGAVQRLRPIFMTVFTTAFALLPVMFGTETGVEIMKRIATPIIGGLATATVQTLFILPAMFLVVMGPRFRRAAKVSKTQWLTPDDPVHDE